MFPGRVKPHPYSLLAVVGSVSLLGILDTTIVTTAIPVASAELGLSPEGRQWIVTAYALVFGAVLLIGGRIADYWGRKRTLMLGVALFCAASAWGGLAHTGVELLLARAVQGGGAALMAPAALAIVTLAYPSGRRRAIAFGVLGAIASSGATVGLILGGLLTETVGWRWTLLVNVPIGVAAIVVAAFILQESRVNGPARYDVSGALLIAMGLSITVFGFTRAGEQPWSSSTLVAIFGGLALLTVFFVIEGRAVAPILPLGIILNRARGAALLVQICAGTVMASVTLYATLHLQQVLFFDPLASGLAMVPLALGIAGGIPVFVRVILRVGIKPTLVVAPSIASIGTFLLAGISEGGSYWIQLLPGLLIMGIGMSGVFVAAQNLALSGVKSADAGAASAASQAATQVGGALGLALVTNLYLTVAGSSISPDDLVDGFSATFIASSAIMFAASLIALLIIKQGPETSPARPSRSDVPAP